MPSTAGLNRMWKKAVPGLFQRVAPRPLSAAQVQEQGPGCPPHDAAHPRGAGPGAFRPPAQSFSPPPAEVLDALPAALLVVDGRGRVAQANPAARRLLGSPLEGTAWAAVIRRCFQAGAEAADCLRLRGGRLVTLATCPLGRLPGQVILLQDVTERRAAEVELARQQRLAAMGETAARLAHQLRTPLAAAMLYVSHLTRPGLDAAAVARVADKLLGRLRHLERLLRDMLIYARGARPGRSRIPAAALLADCRDLMAPLARSAGARLACQPPAGDAVLYGSEEAFTGALQNLVANALEAGARQVVLGAEARPGGGVRLWVEDDGPGVPAGLRERIFEPFFTTRERGTGLGLAVVQAVARAHGGEAWLAPAASGGCRIGLDLPAGGGEDSEEA